MNSFIIYLTQFVDFLIKLLIFESLMTAVLISLAHFEVLFFRTINCKVFNVHSKCLMYHA